MLHFYIHMVCASGFLARETHEEGTLPLDVSYMNTQTAKGFMLQW